MILVNTVRIFGFRGIHTLELSLNKITVMIGTNNAGKTSILKALQLALGDYARYLTDEDFYISPEKGKTEEILVDVRIVPADAVGNRTKVFNDQWATEFGDKIRSTPDGSQFLALRTKSCQNLVKGGFDTARSSLEKWSDSENWYKEPNKESKITSRLLCIPMISIEAQRDIHQELRERSSFVGKILAGVSYDRDDVLELESLIKKVNAQAIAKSEDLSSLKTQLNSLTQSFAGSGSAELTPFPKKVRDLSKNFTVHFGDTEDQTFSMEYHGMGTRSWASMLTVKAFTEIAQKKHEIEAEPFFPILAAEEPEAHLHPNAQKTLYKQLSTINGQIIVSTHSPYLAGMTDVTNIRSIRRTPNGCAASQLLYEITTEEKNILTREINNKRADIIFSRAIILCEGVTEEQILPAMFQIYANTSLHELGISCVSVGGKTYSPFIKLACSLGIPVYIFSDNDGSTFSEIEAQIRRIKKETRLKLDKDVFGISYLTATNDFEAELLNTLSLRPEVIDALVLCETKGSSNERFLEAKNREISGLDDAALIDKLRSLKASYAGYLGEILIENKQQRIREQILPKAAIETFDKLKEWLR